MKNISLNLGGIIGGLIVVAVVAAALYATSQDDLPRRLGKLVLVAALVGGVAGNWLWSLAFPARAESDKGDRPAE